MKNNLKQNQAKEIAFRGSVLKELSKQGKAGLDTETFIRQHNVKIKFRPQTNSGAAWTLWGNIHLNAHDFSTDTPPNNPQMLSLVVHEIQHLRQGFLTALSVYGELDAWQVGFKFHQQLTGSPLNPILQELLILPLGYSRIVLSEASKLMKAHSQGYRIDLLPLYPIHREIAWWITRKEPG